MRKTSQKEIDAVLRLDGPARFSHFVKRVVDEGRAWGLRNHGWALLSDSEGAQLFPLWPAREFAELCRIEDWASYRAEEISLEDLLNELVPKLRERGVGSAIFPTPGGKGVTPSLDELASALREEMEKYEYDE
jgi:hypothetical protein